MKQIKNFLLVVCVFGLAHQDAEAQAQEKTVPQILLTFEEGTMNAEQTYLEMRKVYENGAIHKCITPLHIFSHKHKSEISASVLLDPRKNDRRVKAAQASFTSPSGKFVFTYQTTGSNAVPSADNNSNGVPDFVEWAATAADSSYKVLIETQGYTDPIPAGATYEVAFQELQGTYGFAETYSNPGGPGTRIVLENDFIGFPDNDDPDGDQRGALRVTMAHEFKHAIQFAQNDFDGEADNWAEMDATLMEEVVYDNVNDYYNYLGGSGDVFGNPGVTVIPGSYEDVTWALYFHEKIGSDFWVNAWDRIETSNSTLDMLDAVDQELTSRGLDFTESLLELYTWHFVSGTYNNSTFGFDESLFYPTPSVQKTETQVTDQFSADINLGRFASYMLNVKPPANETGDVSVLIDTESANLSMAVVGLFNDGTVAFEYAESESGFIVVNEGWKWADVERVGAIVLNESRTLSQSFKIKVSNTFPTSIPIDDEKPVTTELKQNYPNPFNPSTTIPVSVSEFQKVEVDIYDITGRLVQSVFNGNLGAGNYNLPVNLENLASGVYMYRLKTNDKVQIKRMTLVK